MMVATGLAAGWVLSAASQAQAHIQLLYPPQRIADQKYPPCGAGGSPRGDTVTVLQPGSTITVAWDETIDHPSHYRISLDMDGDDDFIDPPSMMDFYSNDVVLLDGIADEDASGRIPLRYTQTITLPNVECDNCTLQVIQVMYDKPPYGSGNDIYYQCADLVLSYDAPAQPDGGPGGTPDGGSGPGSPGPDGGTTPGPAGPEGDAGGCQTGDSGSTGAAALVLLSLGLGLGVGRRRGLAGRHA